MKNQLSQRRNIRLSPEAYKGRIIHIIICTRKRTPLFANEDIAYAGKQQILDLSRLKQVKIYAYVIMPDHIHIYWYFLKYGQCLVIMSVISEEFGRGKLAPTNLRKKFNLRNIWQKGFYDNVIFFNTITEMIACDHGA